MKVYLILSCVTLASNAFILPSSARDNRNLTRVLEVGDSKEYAGPRAALETRRLVEDLLAPTNPPEQVGGKAMGNGETERRKDSNDTRIPKPESHEEEGEECDGARRNNEFGQEPKEQSSTPATNQADIVTSGQEQLRRIQGFKRSLIVPWEVPRDFQDRQLGHLRAAHSVADTHLAVAQAADRKQLRRRQQALVDRVMANAPGTGKSMAEYAPDEDGPIRATIQTMHMIFERERATLEKAQEQARVSLVSLQQQELKKLGEEQAMSRRILGYGPRAGLADELEKYGVELERKVSRKQEMGEEERQRELGRKSRAFQGLSNKTVGP